MSAQLDAALRRIAVLEARIAEREAKKTRLLSFVKANVPARPPRARTKRTPATPASRHAIVHLLTLPWLQPSACATTANGVPSARNEQFTPAIPRGGNVLLRVRTHNTTGSSRN